MNLSKAIEFLTRKGYATKKVRETYNILDKRTSSIYKANLNEQEIINLVERMLQIN